MNKGKDCTPRAHARYTPTKHPNWESATEQQKRACLLAQTTSLIITGGAGVGKSFLLGMISETNPAVITATTGTAALLVNGVTTYSALKDEPGMPMRRWIRERSRQAFNGLKGAEVFIVEEGSMMSVAQAERLNEQLQILGARINPDRRKQPFGGYRMMFFLDLAQLPPVDNPDQLLCDAPSIRNLAPEVVFLTQMFRQRTPLLVHVAECTRYAIATPLTVLVGAVMERVASGVWDLVDGIYASATRAPAHEVNEQRMSHFANRVELPVKWEHGVSGVGKYVIQGKQIEVTAIDTKKSRLPPPRNVIGINAPVRILCNDSALRIANGMLGVLLGYDPATQCAVVAVGDADKRRLVRLTPRATYEVCCKVRGIAEHITYKGECIPIEGAFGLTIHKMQGNTVPGIMRVNFGDGNLAPGLLYTGTTRVTTLRHFMPVNFLLALMRARMHPSAEAFLRINGIDTVARRHELLMESRALLPDFVRLFTDETDIPVESLRFILDIVGRGTGDLVRSAMTDWIAAGLEPLFTHNVTI